jgi:hypothetical protein
MMIRAIFFVLFALFSIPNFARAQVLPNICPPPARWVQGGGIPSGSGYMCQCPDGTFLSLGQTCGVPTPAPTQVDAPIYAIFYVEDNGQLLAETRYFMLSKQDTSGRGVTYAGVARYVQTSLGGTKTEDFSYFLSCADNFVRYPDKDQTFPIDPNQKPAKEMIVIYNLWWAVCKGEYNRWIQRGQQ